ncbi:hypothetical protein [Halopseudomonas sp.]
MSMHRKTNTLTEQPDGWVEVQVENGHPAIQSRESTVVIDVR